MIMANFCGICGAALDDKAQCPNCNKNADNEASNNQNSLQKSKNMKKGCLKKGCLFFLSIIGLGIASVIVLVTLARNGVITADLLSKSPEVGSLLDQAFGESCKCGDSAYWKLSEDAKTLLIYGEGELYEENILEKNEIKLSYEEQKSIKYIVVDEGITKLSRHNFYSWEIDCLYLPSTLEEIDNAFYVFAEINQIKLNSDNRFFAMKDDVLFNSDFTALVKYTGCKMLSSYETPETINTICCDAFCGNYALKKLVVSSTTETIEENAFANMHSLEEIVISDSVKEIGDSAFFGCEKLKNVELSAGIEALSEGIFNGCVSLKNIVVPEGVEYIFACAFDGCTSLEKVTLPSTIETLGALSFRDCTNLKEINLPEGLKNLGGAGGGIFENDKGKVFENCTSIKEIIIPASIEKINWGVFSNWTEVQTIYMRVNGPGSEWREEWLENCNAKVVWDYKG